MRAILFDLDGTLLDLDLASFLERYFAALESAAAPLAAHATRPSPVMAALHAATRRMMEHHPGETNQHVFFTEFADLTGIDLASHWPVFEAFYRDIFPTLADTARPAQGAHAAIEAARGLGLQVVIATNPIFPRVAIDHRLSWAGLAEVEFDLVTSYEQMTACKPHPGYYRQIAGLLGIDAADCLMVGDDHVLDMAAADVGIHTYYVGQRASVTADFTGDLRALVELLPHLV